MKCLRFIVAVRGGVCCACLLALVGCKTSDIRCPGDEASRGAAVRSSDFAPFTSEPKARVGSLPCTGPFTLFETADPTRLGTHHYGGGGLTGGREKYKGIVYTREGGFIDIAHLRKAADWTAYHRVRIRHALNAGWNCVVLQSKEASVYTLHFKYPPQWSQWTGEQRKVVIDELSIRLAQRLAITQTSWHEIMTWFGYSSLPFISEKGSAFTYEDTTSHILGAQIAGLALRDSGTHYDLAVTRHLEAELRRLGAVSPDETHRAIAAVEGKWWDGGKVKKLMLDIGEDDGAVTPWLVPEFAGGGTAAKAQPFVIPPLDNVAGKDLSGFVKIEIEPNVMQWGKIRSVLPDRPARVDPDKHFVPLMKYIRSRVGE